MDLLKTNLNNYFYMSLESLRLSDFKAAINLIDLAIIQAAKKDFYMFQKVKMLFVACLYPKCIHYIEENLTYFYEHCSLNIFSQILYYYQQASKGSTDSLYHLLIQKEIPAILAHDYTAILNKKDMSFLEKAAEAMERRDYNLCINYCDLMLKEETPTTSIYLLKGKSHQMLGEYTLAVCFYKQALSLEPDLASTYHRLGIIMMELKQYAKAIYYFQHATRIEPLNSVYPSLLAEGFYKWRKYDSALLYFKKAITLDPYCTEAYLRIADIYNLTCQSRKAKKYYKKSLRLQSHFKSSIKK